MSYCLFVYTGCNICLYFCKTKIIYNFFVSKFVHTINNNLTHLYDDHESLNNYKTIHHFYIKGSWLTILTKYRSHFHSERTNVNLKDKYRNFEILKKRSSDEVRVRVRVRKLKENVIIVSFVCSFYKKAQFELNYIFGYIIKKRIELT